METYLRNLYNRNVEARITKKYNLCQVDLCFCKAYNKRKIDKGVREMSTNINRKGNTNVSNGFLLPIILVIGFIPLIVHVYEYDPNLSQFDWFPNLNGPLSDIFLAWKMVAITVIGSIMILLLLYSYQKNKRSFGLDKPFYFLLGYGVLVILSFFLSKNKFWIARGTFELFEPVWVVLTYLILCYYIWHFVTKEEQVYHILRWSGIGVFLLLGLGMLQNVGYDYLDSKFGQILAIRISLCETSLAKAGCSYWNDYGLVLSAWRPE